MVRNIIRLVGAPEVVYLMNCWLRRTAFTRVLISSVHNLHSQLVVIIAYFAHHQCPFVKIVPSNFVNDNILPNNLCCCSIVLFAGKTSLT